jgi:hypothetical protein
MFLRNVDVCYKTTMYYSIENHDVNNDRRETSY